MLVLSPFAWSNPNQEHHQHQQYQHAQQPEQYTCPVDGNDDSNSACLLAKLRVAQAKLANQVQEHKAALLQARIQAKEETFVDILYVAKEEAEGEVKATEKDSMSTNRTPVGAALPIWDHNMWIFFNCGIMCGAISCIVLSHYFFSGQQPHGKNAGTNKCKGAEGYDIEAGMSSLADPIPEAQETIRTQIMRIRASLTEMEAEVTALQPGVQGDLHPHHQPASAGEESPCGQHSHLQQHQRQVAELEEKKMELGRAVDDAMSKLAQHKAETAEHMDTHKVRIACVHG